MTGPLYKLEPGSAAARAEGCICDPQQPTTTDGPNGKPIKGWRCEPMCPIHGLAIAYAAFHEIGDDVVNEGGYLRKRIPEDAWPEHLRLRRDEEEDPE